jgi:alkyl hydroperoxide reductase subunit AhpC
MFKDLVWPSSFKKYHSCKKWKTNIKENIEFVSISVDNIKDRGKWSNLVNKKQIVEEFNYWQIRT